MVEEHKMAVICTAHLTQRDAEELGVVDAGNFPFTVAVYEEGFVVSCLNVTGEDAPGHGPYAEGSWPSLHACRLWAAQNGYGYLMLDRDAAQVEGLPAYDW